MLALHLCTPWDMKMHTKDVAQPQVSNEIQLHRSQQRSIAVNLQQSRWQLLQITVFSRTRLRIAPRATLFVGLVCGT